MYVENTINNNNFALRVWNCSCYTTISKLFFMHVGVDIDAMIGGLVLDSLDLTWTG